jgi:hypothetical protein
MELNADELIIIRCLIETELTECENEKTFEVKLKALLEKVKKELYK